MSDPRSSSNRGGGVCDAVISVTQIADHVVAANPAKPSQAIPSPHCVQTGPIRLPMVAPEAFIEQFNRIYASVGMHLMPVAPPDADEPQQD